MPSWGMVIDLDKCTGCGTCVHSCVEENNIPVVGEQESDRSRRLNWIQILRKEAGEEHGDHHGDHAVDEKKVIKPKGEGNGRTTFMPILCMHCEDPPCVKVCPVYATYKNPDGLVGQVYWRCIGCRFCMAGCPYTVKTFNFFRYPEQEDVKQALNPDVSVRPKGVVEKCSFCYHRLQKAKDKARLENRQLARDEYVPACVENCPSKAMIFGDLDDPATEVAKLARSPRAFRLLEGLGTKPKVYYLPEGE